MKQWNIFDEPREVFNLCGVPKTMLYGICALSPTEQIYLCNDGNGYYGTFGSGIKDDFGFKSTLCGHDIDTAKKDVLQDYVLHCNEIMKLCKKRINALTKE